MSRTSTPFQPAIAEQILGFIRAGSYPQVAAEAAGPRSSPGGGIGAQWAETNGRPNRVVAFLFLHQVHELPKLIQS
jgi:hypothetical protein